MISLTTAAVDKIATLKMQRQTPDDWLRLSLKSGGCSGFTFHTDFVSSPQDKDKLFEFERDVKVCVDPKSYLFLIGMEIDYEDTLLKSGLVFNIPQSKRSCGCGESFSF